MQDLMIGLHPPGGERTPLGAVDEVAALLERRAQVASNRSIASSVSIGCRPATDS